ncbi:uncharacterized protein TM35_000511370 [Trypanosoma theileri]|uniref:Mucin TcMUCII n=1 Tax=Trypanosoma theileri TaxID=67003 RepID=A0A1X0NH83_9TRYP|nr:uncharacterized protein TM35_000511370 [Trypanosoma theileri]ORC84036.1 hypothetical protein TM35_000511370 [Trypanosoma theileri]
MMMMRTVLCVVLLALYCTCSFVCANTETHVEVSEPEGGGPAATEAATLGGTGQGGGSDGKGGSVGAKPGAGVGGSGHAGTSKGDEGAENIDKLGQGDAQDPLQNQLPGESAPSSLQLGTSSQPVAGDRKDGAPSPSANQNDQIQAGGKAASQENEQVVARTESGNNGGSNSGSEQNTVGSLTAEEPNANSEEQKSENAPTSPNENVTQGTNDAGNSSAVQIQGSTVKESEPENGTTPNTNEESSSTTTTTTTTTLPPETANNKKGDADSSSSISSSVWMRVPLLIVVTLASILVC